MQTQLDRKFSEAEATLAALATDPGLTKIQRKAVRGCLGSIQGVILMRRHALLRPVPAKSRPIDCRLNQLPVGDREGGSDDAA